MPRASPPRYAPDDSTSVESLDFDIVGNLFRVFSKLLISLPLPQLPFWWFVPTTASVAQTVAGYGNIEKHQSSIA